MNKLINWSEVSRLLTPGGRRDQIKSNYKGKAYKVKVERLKKLIKLWYEWQSGF